MKELVGLRNRIIDKFCEMCDLVGAIEAYANKFNLTIEDIIRMKDANKRAFEDGTRH